MATIFRFAVLEFHLDFYSGSDACLKRIIEGCLSLARWILLEKVDFSLSQGCFFLPMLTAEVNHFNSQVSLAENLDNPVLRTGLL